MGAKIQQTLAQYCMETAKLPIGSGIAAFGLSIALAVCALGDPALEGVPAAHEKARYEALRAHSPFSLATAPASTPAPPASFAANWYVSGIGRIGDADFVTIKSRDLSAAFSLFAGESKNAGEVALVSVNWSDVVGKSTVILRKGTETAKLEFNEAELHAAPPPAAGTAQTAKPAVNGAAPIGVPAAPAGARPPGNPPVAMAPNPIAAPRRRVAPIQAPQ